MKNMYMKYPSMVFTAMIEARDGITGLHIKNTGNLVTVLVNVMKKDARFADKITDEYAEMAVADVYDALRSKRHYKDGFSKGKAMAIMKESRGTHFDAEIDDLFLEHIDEMEAVLDTGTDL